jgi:TolB protein
VPLCLCGSTKKTSATLRLCGATRKTSASLRICGAILALVLVPLAFAACNGDDDATPEAPALIAYEAAGDGVTNVFTIDPDTQQSRQLTQAENYDGQPAWSHDRDRIIFISDRGQPKNVTDLYTMAADGSDVQRLTNTPDAAERSPKYAPDGSRIATPVLRDGEYFLATLAPDGTDEQVLAGPYRFVEFPSWRHDGKEIYFAAIGPETQSIDILSVNVDSKAVTVRVSTPSADVCPHFSFDGKYMTYARSPGGPNEEPDLFRRPLDQPDDVSGATDERLTENEARDDYANPSPDDARYVFVSNRDGDFELYVMDRDATNVVRITNTPALKENVPDW